MKITREIMTRLPADQQAKILDKLMKSGKVFEFPVFNMLLSTLEYCGLNLESLKRNLTDPKNKKRRVIDICRTMGSDFEKQGEAAERISGLEAVSLYRSAVLSFLFADWLSHKPEDTIENYRLLIPCQERICALSIPPIEKLIFPCYKGKVYAYLSIPDPVKFAAPYPTVIFVQGNDEVKEMNAPFEAIAHERGMAVLNLDPPGWGESALTGNHFKNAEVYKAAIQEAVDYIEGRDELDQTRIASFGVSFGGVLTHFAASLDHRIKASAGMGGPLLDNRKMRENVPAAQKVRTYMITGVTNEDELEQWTNDFDIDGRLGQVIHPALIVHGRDDNLVPVSNAEAIAERISGPATVMIMPGCDHMCTQKIGTDVAPMMFDWIKKQLQ